MNKQESITAGAVTQSNKVTWKTGYLPQERKELRCAVCEIDFVPGEYMFVSSKNETLCLECVADRMNELEERANA